VLVLTTLPVLAASHASVAPGGTWHGTAEGILVDDTKSHSGSPPDDVVTSSVDNYQVELSFSFSVDSSGTISGTGNGSYADAHWHLEGHNGTHGDFSCDPPVDGKRFPVVVTGHASGGGATLSLAIPAATETNADYSCGAGFSGYATTSHYMADSLALVGGDHLDISLTQPTSLALPKTVSTSSGGETKTHVHIWSFSFTPPTTRGGGGGGGGPCSLALSGVGVKPSPAKPGRPVTVSFRNSVAAQTHLLLTTPHGVKSTVDTRKVPAGRNALLWSGWIGRLPAAAGRYTLTVEATACAATRRNSVSLSTAGGSGGGGGGGAGGGGGGGSSPPPATGTATGTVTVNGKPFTSGSIPYNSKVDVTNGTLLLKTDTGSMRLFGSGVFAKFQLLRGTDNKKPIVELRLIGGDFSVCKRKTSGVSRAAAAKVVRQLWGNGKGRFRTRGRYAAATVRGTLWLTADRCDGTLTQVRRGIVQVSDFRLKKQITVRAGKSYLAKP
jgi:hypothetical protein